MSDIIIIMLCNVRKVKLFLNIVSQKTYFGEYVPILLFGIISFIAGALAFLFPETKDLKLPDTVKQAEFVGEA